MIGAARDGTVRRNGVPMSFALPPDCLTTRRRFLRNSAALGAAAALLAEPGPAAEPGLTIVGPKQGYSPQIGTLVSEMAFMRDQVLRAVKGLSQKDLDFLLDDKANTIGALLLHLAAVEALFQANTFAGSAPGEMPEAFKAKWGMAMELGEPARKSIKGNGLDHYLDILGKTRESTLAEFKKRDDQWLQAVDQSWGWGPTNNYCKWFHVTEHEANHNGQIKFLKGRLPGAKAAGE